MLQNDYAYFALRERIERESAERARDQTARRAHLAMAEGYADRLRAMRPPAEQVTA